MPGTLWVIDGQDRAVDQLCVRLAERWFGTLTERWFNAELTAAPATSKKPSALPPTSELIPDLQVAQDANGIPAAVAAPCGQISESGQ